MANLSRRKFLAASAALTALSSSTRSLLAQEAASHRILVGSDTPNGILAFAWNPLTGTLKPEPIAAKVDQSTWIELSPDSEVLYVACELDQFQGKPTGAVASYRNEGGKLTQLSVVPSEGKGTCFVTTDFTGRVVICANYAGGSASSFLSRDGKLSDAVWTEHYPGYGEPMAKNPLSNLEKPAETKPKETKPDGTKLDGAQSEEMKPKTGPVAERQDAAHAHFICVHPGNRFVFVNDLGNDKIHIYTLDHQTGRLIPANSYSADPGAGPRTLHFLTGEGPMAGKIAYSVNELNSTVDVLTWSPVDGSLKRLQLVELHPRTGPGIVNTACDAALTRDGRFAYFANRGDDFLMSFTIDPATGKLTPLGTNPRVASGGKTPRNLRLDPTERWMLVANQNSGNITVFARNPKTGELAKQGKSYPAATPMCIAFV